MPPRPYRRDRYYIATSDAGEEVWIYDLQRDGWWTPGVDGCWTKEGMRHLLGEGELRLATPDEIEEIDREVFS
jgi:hypothetical protein